MESSGICEKLAAIILANLRMISTKGMTKRNTLKTHIPLTSLEPDCLKTRPGMQYLGMMWLS